MARRVDKTDSYIEMVLGLNGRVRVEDLQSIPQESRSEALRTFAETHGAEMQLHLEGDELVTGLQPDPAAALTVARSAESAPTTDPTATTMRPTDLTAEGESALDLLLGDYDGVPRVPAEPVAAAVPAAVVPAAMHPSTPEPQPAGAHSAAAATPAASETPADTSRRWLLWWIPTLLVPVIGGAAAWFFLRRSRAFAARAMLTTALAFGLLISIAWLRYAERFAAITEQRAAERVIVIPSK